MAKRLTPEHPISKKIQALFNYMEDQGISLEIGDYGVIRVVTEGRTVYLKETEGQFVTELPPTLEWKLVDES